MTENNKSGFYRDLNSISFYHNGVMLFKHEIDERYTTWSIGNETYRYDKYTKQKFKFDYEKDLWYLDLSDEVCPHCGSLLNNKLGC